MLDFYYFSVNFRKTAKKFQMSQEIVETSKELDKNDKFSLCFPNFHSITVNVFKSSQADVDFVDGSNIRPPVLRQLMLDLDDREKFRFELRYTYSRLLNIQK